MSMRDTWSGAVLSIPQGHVYQLAKRELEILEAKRAGASIDELVARFAMTERGINKLLARTEQGLA